MNPYQPNPQPSPRIPQDALLKLVQTLSQVQVFWRTKRDKVAGMRQGTEHARIDMSILAPHGVGVDELRTQYNEQADENQFLLRGERGFTLHLQATSTDDNLEGFDLCERVRFRLRTETAGAIYKPAGLSIKDVQGTVTLPNATLSSGGTERSASVASMDIRWNWVAFADPGDPDEGNYIATVNGGPEPGTIIPITFNPPAGQS